MVIGGNNTATHSIIRLTRFIIGDIGRGFKVTLRHRIVCIR